MARAPVVMPEKRAAIVIDAMLSGTGPAAEKHGVSRRSVERCLVDSKTDQELSRLVAEKKAAADKAWAEEIPSCLRACIEYLHRAASESQNRTPEMVHAIAGALKMVSEVAATWKVLDVHLERFRGGAVPKVLPFLPGSNGGNGNGHDKAATSGE